MIKVALLLSSGAVCTAKHRKNSNPELYNQFLFCNSFLLFVRYLHGGQEDMYFKVTPYMTNQKRLIIREVLPQFGIRFCS